MLDVNDTQGLSGWFSYAVWIRKSCAMNLLFTCGHNSGYYFAPCQIARAVLTEWLRAKVMPIHGMMKTQVRIRLANFLPETRFFKIQVLNGVCSTPDFFNPIPSGTGFQDWYESGWHLVKEAVGSADFKISKSALLSLNHPNFSIFEIAGQKVEIVIWLDYMNVLMIFDQSGQRTTFSNLFADVSGIYYCLWIILISRIINRFTQNKVLLNRY